MSGCICGGVGWVCENHTKRPWGGISNAANACQCGAGQPCEICNQDMSKDGFDGGVILASVEPIPDGKRMH